MVSMITVQYHYGLGRHFFYLDSHQKIYAIKFNFVTQPLGETYSELLSFAKVFMLTYMKALWRQHLVEWQHAS